ncbi:cobalamin B12-binding domain-containing protein [Protofrankia symbiont of Coriaria ruscifolia]|uniref:cobalamin B12-binding domain-containing protein n=1 Tax=Protofrankia symbiont of Coriaria ruscifolia TaxID=1306542 RepID=UPI001A94454D|nr:cobalamin-dependent protein [Protofrankia symbiont of Coriaria ruscifolia]
MSTLVPPHRRVLLTTVSSDSHTWNLVFLQLLLEEAGHQVLNLGPCAPDDLILASIRTYRPDVLVVSTVNGHGRMDGARLVRRIRADPSIRYVPAVIGGRLGIHGGAEAGTVTELLGAGFDAVCNERTDPRTLTNLLLELGTKAEPKKGVA